MRLASMLGAHTRPSGSAWSFVAISFFPDTRLR